MLDMRVIWPVLVDVVEDWSVKGFVSVSGGAVGA